MLGEVIGSHDGKLFRSFAQSLTLDGLLAVAGVLGARRTRERYRSTTPDVLAGALIRLAFDDGGDRIVEGAELRP